MPELPEVQTTVDALARTVCGRTIMSAWMDPRKPVNTGSNARWPAIRRHLAGRNITAVTRRAKYIVMTFDDGSRLWVHQKMTGHLLAGAWTRRRGQWVSTVAGPLTDDPTNRFIRMLLMLDDGSQVALSDARRFARVILTKGPETEARELARLGPEPLELSTVQFVGLLSGRRGLVKSRLVDPAFIVGIGNIYADEILHRAGIHPFARLERLTPTQIRSIYKHMRTILTAAIAAGGSSTDDYRAPDGTRGGYQGRHRVYQRTGQPCSVCHRGTIVRTVRNGRSSHFCPAHQPTP